MSGSDLDRPGTRAVPGLTYLTFRPVFAEHFHEADDEDDEDDESIDAGLIPSSVNVDLGLIWLGRLCFDFGLTCWETDDEGHTFGDPR